MFEAIHGSAPTIAGKDVANPSGLINAAIMMLVHIGQPEAATAINNAWLYTLESGMHTADIYRIGASHDLVGTQAFAQAVIENLGKMPDRLKAASFYPVEGLKLHQTTPVDPDLKKELVGVDVFIDWKESNRNPQVIGEKLKVINGNGLALKMITNRGVKVYPEGLPETFCTDHWRCRFVHPEGKTVTPAQILDLLRRVHEEAGLEFIKTEHLYYFNGERGYTLGQGE